MYKIWVENKETFYKQISSRSSQFLWKKYARFYLLSYKRYCVYLGTTAHESWHCPPSALCSAFFSRARSRASSSARVKNEISSASKKKRWWSLSLFFRLTSHLFFFWANLTMEKVSAAHTLSIHGRTADLWKHCYRYLFGLTPHCTEEEEVSYSDTLGYRKVSLLSNGL